MSKISDRIEICDGVGFRSVTEDRFKLASISMNLLIPLSDSSAKYAIVPYLLRRACEKYPEYTALRRKLAMLYGASISASVARLGDMQKLTLSVYSLDDRFVPDKQPVSTQCAELLRDILLSPAFRDGVFREEDVETEKRLMCERIDSERNDKRTYARQRFIETMTQGEPYGFPPLGRREEVEELTAKEITDGWHELIKTAQIDIIAIGTLNPDKLCQSLRQAFGGFSREYSPLPGTIIKEQAQMRQDITESADMQQANLYVGFRTPMSNRCDDTAMRLMCTCLGGSPTSRLFTNVRERLSLCYYCSSQYLRDKGLLMIGSGLEKDKVPQALEEILAQLESIKNGELTADEIAAARLAMINDLRGYNDYIMMIDDWYSRQLSAAQMLSPEEVIVRLERVTPEDIAKAANTLSIDTVYLLCNEEVSE